VGELDAVFKFAAVVAEDEEHEGGHDHKKHQRAEQHAADNDGCQGALHLAADAGGNGGGQQPDAGGKGGHQHGAHALFGRVEHGRAGAEARTYSR